MPLLKNSAPTPAPPPPPTASASARNAQLHDQRTRADTQLTDLANATGQDNDPHLFDELPYLPGILNQAPAHLIEQLLAALNVECLFRKDDNQASIWVTITDTTPATITALLADPRADHNQPGPTRPASSPATPCCGELAQSPIAATIHHDHGRPGGGAPPRRLESRPSALKRC
jgi:hypothetical protein